MLKYIIIVCIVINYIELKFSNSLELVLNNFDSFDLNYYLFDDIGYLFTTSRISKPNIETEILAFSECDSVIWIGIKLQLLAAPGDTLGPPVRP